ncbi:TOMT methyltransferase, partial [Eubucco bourcierii]|nr:TOMT methyltransferase [Eubucco bourcierii]
PPPRAGRIVERLLAERAPLRLLELGTYCGYATVLLAQGMPPGARLYSVESNPEHAAVAEKVLRLAGIDEQRVRMGTGARRRLRQQHQLLQIDFVFMAHGKSCYLRDLRLLESQRLLAPGATVLADNVLCPGAPRFLRYVRSCGRYRCRLHRASLQY